MLGDNWKWHNTQHDFMIKIWLKVNESCGKVIRVWFEQLADRININCSLLCIASQ